MKKQLTKLRKKSWNVWCCWVKHHSLWSFLYFIAENVKSDEHLFLCCNLAKAHHLFSLKMHIPFMLSDKFTFCCSEQGMAVQFRHWHGECKLHMTTMMYRRWHVQILSPFCKGQKLPEGSTCEKKISWMQKMERNHSRLWYWSTGRESDGIWELLRRQAVHL